MGIKSESGSTGTTDKAYEMALIEESIAETERDVAEGTELLAVLKSKLRKHRTKT